MGGAMVNHDSPEKVAYPVTVESLGRIAVPEGHFVAADPYVMGPNPAAFEQVLPVEEAEVLAARAAIGPGHNRVAALILKCRSAPIEFWTMATLGGQDVAALEVEAYYGYPVDAGTGSFGGVDAMVVTERVLATDAGMLDDPISKALFADGLGTESAVVAAPEEGAVPVAVCSSGWGDGAYGTWLGRASDGAIVVAVTDFMLTGDPYAASLPEPVPPAPTPQSAPTPSLMKRLFGRA